MRPNWGGGAFGEILDDGEIRVGDAVSFEHADETAQAATHAPDR